jgi:hypothetical protein
MGRAKPVTLLPLIALIFYEVSGGPFGIEVGAGWVDGWERCGMDWRMGCVLVCAG